MKDLKNAMIACACIVVLSVAGFAIWTVRQYLPLVGIVLLGLLVIGAILTVAYAVEHIARRATRYEHHQISQYGSVLHRHNRLEIIAPYHPNQLATHRAGQADVVEGEIEELEEMPALLPRIPTFAEMLESGMIQGAISQGQMVLGYYADTHQPRMGSWLDLYSAGNGGVSGSGKSTTTRFLLFQAILAGAKLVMIDPHINNPKESLSHQFSLLPASIHQIRPCDGADVNVMKRVDWLDREMARRQKTNMVTPGLVFVIDEFNAVIRKASKEVKEKLEKVLLDIEQEGRKFGIFALLIGQRWSAQDLGGADIRTSLASKIAHRFSDEDQAKRFIGSKYGKVLLALETGHWLFYDTTGKTSEMVTPETLSEDGSVIAQIITGVPASGPASRRAVSTSIGASRAPLYLLPGGEEDVTTDADMEAVDAGADVTTGELEPLTSEAVRVLNMLREKKGQNEIIEEIWGFKSTDGRPYRAAVEEYRGVLATLASRIGA